MFKKTFHTISRAACACLLLASSLASADVSGSWSFAVEVMGQNGVAAVTMTQGSDGTIAGHYTGQIGDADFTGTANGNDFQFVLVVDAGSITYKGTLQEDGTIKGSLDLSGMAEGTFVGRKAN
jgi:hypothetical protein